MTTILDLPDEIRLLIGKKLPAKSIYSLIRVCRSFYSSFIPCLWSYLSIIHFKSGSVPAEQVRVNAQRVKDLTFSSILTKDYYTIDYPRVHTLRMMNFYQGDKDDHYLQVLPQEKVDFLRRHPFIKKLVYQHNDALSKEFWDVVKTEWAHLEELEFTGVVEHDAVDAFWKTCERVQNLHLLDVTLRPETMPILSTLSFQRLRDLTITKFLWRAGSPRRMWPVQLLERAKGSENLKRLEWNVGDVVFPVQVVLDAFEENSWPELSKLSIGGVACPDQDVASVLRRLTSRRLTDFELWSGGFGPLTYSCLKEMYFEHLRDLKLSHAPGATSGMIQEILTECVHLVNLDVPYIFVRDIATASRGWGCLKLERLVVYIANQAGDEADWDGRVFEQIARLRRVRSLDLQRDPHALSSNVDGDHQLQDISALQTLDFRLPSSSSCCSSRSSTVDFVTTTATRGSIRSWSSLLQLKEFSFDGDRQWLGVSELEWMVEHWRELECISGDFRAAAGEEDGERLKQLLIQHDISYYCDS